MFSLLQSFYFFLSCKFLWEQHSKHYTKQTSSLSPYHYVLIQRLVCDFFQSTKSKQQPLFFSIHQSLPLNLSDDFDNRVTVKSCVNDSVYHLARIRQQRWRIHSNIFVLCLWFPQCNQTCPACENREALSCKLPSLSALLCLSITSVTPCSSAKWLVSIDPVNDNPSFVTSTHSNLF